MNIDRLRIHNYKSLVDFELVKPNSFSVFVGPNAAGKSNIFEALEFLSYMKDTPRMVSNLFGTFDNYLNRKFDRNRIKNNDKCIEWELNMENLSIEGDVIYFTKSKNKEDDRIGIPIELRFNLNANLYVQKFSRLFANNPNHSKIKGVTNEQKLNIDASNLAPVLKRILKDETIREEFTEWVELLIPEFENITVHSDNISGHDTLLIKEKYTDKPFTTNLISDGTLNILALLTAVYQSNEPQFLCIEEPENGLNPYVIKELVGFFREMCEEKGHIIWLNTHSQTLVSQLTSDEIILIDKKEGITQAKQLNGFNSHGLTMDEAWLTNALGGGLPW